MCLFTPSRLQEEGGTSPCSASSGKAVTEWLQYFALLLTSSNHPEGSTPEYARGNKETLASKWFLSIEPQNNEDRMYAAKAY